MTPGRGRPASGAGDGASDDDDEDARISQTHPLEPMTEIDGDHAVFCYNVVATRTPRDNSTKTKPQKIGMPPTGISHVARVMLTLASAKAAASNNDDFECWQ